MSNNHAAFVGEIPTNYERYLGPLIFDTYAEDLANRINLADDALLLETAAGTGLATRKIRDRLSTSVRIIATDLNADMLSLAQSKFEADENIEFQTADAQALDYADASFDAIACQFSVMFFPDKPAALKEAARVLKPGGQFCFNVWDSLEHNDLVRVVNERVAALFSDAPPDFFNTPFGYFAIDEIKRLLGDTGFSDIDIAVLPRTSTAPGARDVALGFVTGTPLRLQIESLAPERLMEVVDRVEEAIVQQFGDGPVSAKMQAITFVAHRSV